MPKELICCKCGKSFIGNGAYFCPDCRWEFRKKNKPVEVKPKKSVKVQKEQLVSDICPNYNRQRVNCIVCHAGAFEYKDCGTGRF